MRITSAVTWLPRRIRREFRDRGGDTRFLMWISFLLAFLWARIWVTYFTGTPMIGIENGFQIGAKTVIFGYHPHHIATGVLFLAIAGWIGLPYGGRVLTRFAAILYGTGLGLIVDEVGFIVTGITYRQDFPEVFVLVVTISGFFMSTVYFPSFWKSVDARLARICRRVAAWTRDLRGVPPDPTSEAGPDAAPAAEEASGTSQ